MRLTIEGYVFCFVGQFQTCSHAYAAAEVEGLGGVVHQAISTDVDVIVVGPETHLAPDSMPGVVMLSEREFKRLLYHGSLVVEPPAEVRDVATELLGEVRSIFDGGYTLQRWMQLTEVVGGCHKQHLDVLLDYIQGAMRRWSGEGIGFCPAPRRWQHAISKGHRSPKFQLIRALEVMPRLRGPDLEETLGHPDLVGVTCVDLGNCELLTAQALDVMLEGPISDHLQEVLCSHVSRAVGRAWARIPRNTLQIHTLRMLDSWTVSTALFKDFGRANASRGVRTLELGTEFLTPLLTILSEPGYFDTLEHLILRGNLGNSRKWSSPLSSLPITRLTLRSAAMGPETWRSLFDDGWPENLLELDVSEAMRKKSSQISHILTQMVDRRPERFASLERLYVKKPTGQLRRALSAFEELEVVFL